MNGACSGSTHLLLYLLQCFYWTKFKRSIKSDNYEREKEDLNSLISLKVIKSTWIQIRDKDEKIIFSKLMDNDDEYSYPLNENYFITTGNAGNILISIGGKIFGKLGKNGEVIESLLISKESE